MNGSHRSTIDVCVCTHRRAHLRETLSSFARLERPGGVEVSILVVDNDEIPSALSLVDEVAAHCPYPVAYLHAPAHNISVARNAALKASKAAFLAFLDDDECAPPLWLVHLVTQQRQKDADVVLGPVTPRYPATCPAWISRGNFHAIKPVWVHGHIVTGYTSNVLLKRTSPALCSIAFDPVLGRTGGEDTVYFSILHEAGARIDYAPRALIFEDVGPERLTLSWLLRRMFRSGQSHGTLLMRNGNNRLLKRSGNALAALSKISVCAVMATVLGAAKAQDRARFWLLRGALHTGTLARLAGVSELHLYG